LNKLYEAVRKVEETDKSLADGATKLCYEENGTDAGLTRYNQCLHELDLISNDNTLDKDGYADQWK